ncbi:ribosomal protein L7/L12 [Streptomyces sp. NPDC058463]|uniref:ribosomal protein L7/L12 n=1 Tax=Streptomyces sp. NPDC058463 TaxID=3346510 RepID=UPI0036616483
MRRMTGLSLWRSKVLATQVPAAILVGVPQDDADAAVTALREAGARAEAREHPEPDHLKP